MADLLFVLTSAVISVVSYVLTKVFSKLSRKIDDPWRAAIAKTSAMIVALPGGIVWEMAERYEILNRIKYSEVHDVQYNRAKKIKNRLDSEVFSGVLS